jgi:hypothetical protein
MTPRVEASSAPAAPVPVSPRAAMLAHLTADMGAALAVGDVEAARAAHEVIGRLLGAPGVPATIVDLAAERERRGSG